jgi:hypothetical protein
VNLKSRTGRLYETPNDNIVGIGYASERTKDRWWIGLPKRDNYSSIALIVESRLGEYYTFVFPENFIRQYQDNFSLGSYGEEFNFDVKRVGGSYFLAIRNHSDIPIEDFRDNFQNLPQ